MDIYFDESRNTGELGYSENNNALNYDNQRYFILAGFIKSDDLTSKYIEFKNKWIKHINKNNPESTIIKGNDLVIRDNNQAMTEFIDSVINYGNFYITIYDKKFFIVTQMINWLTTMISDYAYEYFMLFTEFLIKIDDEYISKYLYITKNSSKKNIENFIDYVISYPYTECAKTKQEIQYKELWINIIKELKEKDEDYLDTLCKTNAEYIYIKGGNRNNIVNLTALGETILLLKKNSNLSNSQLNIYHDNIEIVQDYISHYWEGEIKFINDNESIQIQIVDNISSILGNLINKVFPVNSDKDLEKLLGSEYNWVRKNLQIIYSKIDNRNIKMVIALREMAVFKSFLKNINYGDLLEFKQEIFRRLDIRYSEELRNHLSHTDASKILKF